MLDTDSIFADKLDKEIAEFITKVRKQANTACLGSPAYNRPTLLGSSPEAMTAGQALAIMNQATAWQEYQGNILALADAKWKYLKGRLKQVDDLIKFQHGNKPTEVVLKNKQTLESMTTLSQCVVMLLEHEFKRLQKVRDHGSRVLTKLTKI